MANPKVAAIIQDPALEKAAESRNILPLLQNKHVQAAANDPKLLSELKAFDLTGALDYALQPEIVPPPGNHRRPVSPNSPRAKAHATNTSSQSITTPGKAN